MRRRTLVFGAMTIPLAPAIARAATTQAAGPTKGPSVLELFTSQGCSSCPPADALLGELARRPDTIALAWHVDYWNYLGWKDPYAEAAWTERQKEYARRLNAEVYTPALVVNGATMVVGSDRRAVAQAMQATPTPTGIALRRTATGLVAQYDAWADGARAQLVFYDPENATAVARGENGGRQLKEYCIVRQVLDVPMGGPATTGTIALPPPIEGRGAVLLVRDARGQLLAAGHLPPGKDVAG